MIELFRVFISQKEDAFIAALRIALGLVFFWFGALKVVGYNPVYDIVSSTFPMLAGGIGNIVLGAAEAIIGILLFLNAFATLAHILLVLHLSGTFLTFVSAPGLMFDPYFPVLTLSGEFVFKNAVLAIAGLVVFSHEQKMK